MTTDPASFPPETPLDTPNWAVRIIRNLRRCRHYDWMMLASYWIPTAWNGFGCPTEEQCISCGEYRHRILDHRIAGREEWKPGRHPKSHHLRPCNEFLKALADLLEKHNAELLSCDMEPIDIIIGGDYMTVTTIPSAATPQDVRNAQL